MPDAVVIGSGPNGLVAANLLADQGWDVVVVEAAGTPGGAVRSAEATVPGYVHDLFSSFYPMAARSPVIAALGLERFGLRWCRHPVAVAHPLSAGRAAFVSPDVEVTAASLESLGAGDGARWRANYAEWQRVGGPVMDALLGPFPPVRALGRIVAALGGSPRDLARFTRFALLPARRMAEERFGGEGAAALLGGNALHTDISPEGAGSGLFGWLLCMLAQEVGFPVPEGGAQSLTDALIRRLEAGGGRVVCDQRVVRVVVRDRRAVAVRTADGTEIDARRAVLAGCDALALYRRLLEPEHLPGRLLHDLAAYQPSQATVKVDWALDGPVPWTNADARRAGTVHVGGSLDELTITAAQLAAGMVPERPFLLFGQYAAADHTRAPAGGEVGWAYAHVPQVVKGDAGGDGIAGIWDDVETKAIVERMEQRIEEYAPGFRGRVVGRHVLTPAAMEAANANLVNGDVMGGTSALHQQLIFRPTPGLGRPETPVKRLYLASASAHPGGGVHGACGANAARAALAHDRAGRFGQRFRPVG
jgi:phytoene dehydrogenase-like protein